jgi:hypothetical protein
MISNQILQNTIEGLKAITRIDISIMDTEGKVLASTVENPEQYENIVFVLCSITCRQSGYSGISIF